MNLEISCELYARLSAIPTLLSPDDDRKYLRSIYLERRNGQLIAVSTNVKLAAIEHVGASAGPDGHTAIVVDQVLISKCQNEIPFNSSLSIVANPALNYTAIKTTFGYQYPGNGMVELPVANSFESWREWMPDEMPTASVGAMYWDVEAVHALATASPTGGVCFPEFIDITKPVVVRDHDNANWFGLFMPHKHDEAIEGATVPDWAR